jgi:hypothetical protein
VSRFDLRFRVVIAGSGFRRRECMLSIMQLEKLRALRLVNDARLSGISVKRFAERSSECKV